MCYTFSMAHIFVSIELNQRISSVLSILLILLLGTLVALLVLRAAHEVIILSETSPIYHIEKRPGSDASGVVGVDSVAPLNVGCAKDAKICPDGSIVRRIAPVCEFAPCLVR